MFNPKTFLIFAQKVQYNTLLDMKIQEVMKLQRKALGITQQDLADMSEIAISTIKKIESGKGNPSLSTVEKIWISLAWRLNMRFVKQFKN